MAERQLAREDVVGKVSAILSDLLSIRKEDGKEGKKEKLAADTDIYADLSIDSVESLDFLTALEEEFGVNPDQFEAAQKRTVREIADYIMQLLSRKEGKGRA